MRYISILCIVFLWLSGVSQRINPHSCDEHSYKMIVSETGSNLSNDTTIDINFYHIDIEIALDSAYISGSVQVGFTSLINDLTQIRLDLDSAYTIDSISLPANSFDFTSNIITIDLQDSYNIGDQINLTIYYKGIPILAGGYKGLRYETHDNDELIIATLSTPYLAHTWWPCKDGTQDKSDSTFIDISIKDTLVGTIPVAAISNGMLETIEASNGMKTFKWKHRYPVVPYYVMVAISNYEHFQQEFTGSNYSFPIDYYVFDSHWDEAHAGVELIPDAIGFFTDVFGTYPFKDEKYGMTQLGYYGAIENQTNTITNNMSPGWFFVSVHELAHMWFADMITCNTWHHGWLNEGFASYAEALYSEYKYDDYKEYIKNFLFYGGGTVYMEDVSNPFDVFKPIIYNKGAYVLHMLRGVVGDEVFFDIIYQYANDINFQYGLATTEEFQAVCEEVSNTDLDYFFDQWIYDERFPMYYYNYEFNLLNGDVGVVINQIQGVMGWREVFDMPLEIQVDFTDGTDTIIEVFNDEKYSYYSLILNKEVDTVIIDPNSWVLRNIVLDPDIIVSSNNVEEFPFEIYPNPSNGRFMVSAKGQDLFNENNVELVSISGSYQGKIIISNQDVVEFNNVRPGVYLLKVVMSGKQYVKKVVVLD